MAALNTFTAALLLAIAGLAAGVPVYPGNATVHWGTATVHEGNATVHQGNATVHWGTATVHEGNASVHEGNATVLQWNATVNHGDGTMQGNATVHQQDATAHQGNATEHHGNATVHQGNATMHQGNVSSQAQSDHSNDDVFQGLAKKFLFSYVYTWEDVKYLQDQLDGKSFPATNVTDVIVSGYVMPNPKDIYVIEKYHYPHISTMPAHRRAEIEPVAEPLEKIYDQIISTMSFDEVHSLYCAIRNPFVIDVFDYKDTEFSFENIEKIFQASAKMYGFSNGTLEKLHEIFMKANTDMPAGSFPSGMTTLHFGAHFQSYLALKYPVLDYLLLSIYPIFWAADDQRFDPRIDNGPIWWE